MTQEEKQLLLVDLCGRLPHELKCNVGGEIPYTLRKIEIDDKNGHLCDFIETKDGLDMQVYLSEVKPYLFPMSSMTEEQKEEYHYIVNYISPDDTDNWKEGEFIYVNQMTALLHFYHKNHLDYKGLIPMDLAIDATGKHIY